MRHGTCSGYAPTQHAGVGDSGAALQIVCAWCQLLLRQQRVPTPPRFTISYSICARCYGDVARESADSTVSTPLAYVTVGRNGTTTCAGRDGLGR